MITITHRLTVGLALAVTGGVVLALAAGRWLLRAEMIDNLDALHQTEFQEVLLTLGEQPGQLPRTELVERMRRHSEADAELFFFQVHDGAGHIIFRSPSLGPAMLPDLSLRNGEWTVEIPPFGRVHTSEFVRAGLHFQVASRLEPAERVLRTYTRISGVIVGVAALASLGLGFGISRLALGPIRAIERTARRISADNLAERIPAPPGRDEVAELARLLNVMFDRLEASFGQVRRFSADASHELKTPLALIRLNAEQLQRRTAGDGESAALVADLLEEIDRMHQVIERLLFLARAESGTLPLDRQRQEVAAFVAALAEDAAALAEDRALRFTVVRNDAGAAAFDAGLLRQLLLNLVANALEVSPAGGGITLASDLTPGTWRIEVTDEGPGLPEAQLEQAFGRFVRLAGEKRPGQGLGLAICRGIAHLHQGEVRLRNRTDRPGLVATLEIPARGK